VTRELANLQKLGLIERTVHEERRALAVVDVDHLQQLLQDS
tara:strand:+ start:260 stop:382 length:123 start_codon:yes stop_codon:yes gene_type:complete